MFSRFHSVPALVCVQWLAAALIAPFACTIGVRLVSFSDASLWGSRGLAFAKAQWTDLLSFSLPPFADLSTNLGFSASAFSTFETTVAYVALIIAGVALAWGIRRRVPARTIAVGHLVYLVFAALSLGVLTAVTFTRPLEEPIPEYALAITVPEGSVGQWAGARVGSPPTVFVLPPDDAAEETGRIGSAELFLVWDVQPAVGKQPEFTLWVPGGWATVPEDAEASWGFGHSCARLRHEVVAGTQWLKEPVPYTRVTCTITPMKQRHSAEVLHDRSGGTIFKDVVVLDLGPAVDQHYRSATQAEFSVSTTSGSAISRGTAVGGLPHVSVADLNGELSLNRVDADVQYVEGPRLYQSTAMHLWPYGSDKFEAMRSRLPPLSVLYVLRQGQALDGSSTLEPHHQIGRAVLFDGMEQRNHPYVARVAVRNANAEQRRAMMGILASMILGGGITVQALRRND